MKTIYLARHGEAVPLGFQGIAHDFDRHLSEQGKSSLQQQAKAFHSLTPRLEACYTSPLVRAWQTASLLTQHHGLTPSSTEALGAAPQLKAVFELLQTSPAEQILLVTHQPFINRLFSTLLTGETDLSAQFGTGTIAAIQLQHLDQQAYGELKWFLPAGLMLRIQADSAP